MKKKALLVSGIYFPDIGGPATFIPKLAKFLVARNFDVTVFSLSDEPKRRLPNEPWKREFTSRSLSKIIRIPIVIYRLYKLIDSDTIVFANGLHEEVAIAARLNHRKAGVAKIVGDPIWERAKNRKETDLSIEDFNKSRLSTRQRFERVFLKKCLNQYKVVTTPSQQLSEIVENWGVKSQIKVITNGVELPEKNLSVYEYDICTVSRLVTWKNLDLLIRSCQGLDLKLCIVGSGPEKDLLVNLAKDLKVNVTFKGDLEPNAVSDVLNASRCYCLISNYEGLSFSLLEAMAHGRPVIVSDVRGNISVVETGRNGVVLKHLSLEYLRSALVDLLKNPEKQLKFGAEAEKTIRENYLLENKLLELEEYLSD